MNETQQVPTKRSLKIKAILRIAVSLALLAWYIVIGFCRGWDIERLAMGTTLVLIIVFSIWYEHRSRRRL